MFRPAFKMRTPRPKSAVPDSMRLSTTANLPEQMRPKNLNEVVGHSDVVSALQSWKKTQEWPRAILFCGPSGVGKSTFANLISLGVNGNKDVHEVNAGSQGGIGKVRELIELSRRKTLSGKPRVIIVDEAHALTSDAVNALLVPLERGSPDTVWVFSTTEANRLTVPLKRRFRIFNLDPVSPADLVTVLQRAAARLSVTLTKKQAAVFAEAARGSPSLALSALERWCDAGCPKTSESFQAFASADPGDTQTTLAFEALNALLEKDARAFLKALLAQTSDTSFLFVAHVVLKGYIESSYLPPPQKAHGLFYAFRKGASVKPSNWHCLKLLKTVLALESQTLQGKESIYCALLPLLSESE